MQKNKAWKKVWKKNETNVRCSRRYRKIIVKYTGLSKEGIEKL